MGEAQLNRVGYICGSVDENEVGEKGCRHLSKATAWGELEVISLGHCSFTQGGTKSGRGDAGTSVGEAKELALVFIKIFQIVVAWGRRGAGRWPSGKGT